MRGVLHGVIDTYRHRGLQATVDRSITQFTSILRRYLSILQWRVTNVAEISTEAGGFLLHAKTPAERETIWYLDEYEHQKVEQLIEILEDSDVFFDVGSNIGYYACAAATLSDATVHAFEPHPENAARIEDNLGLNDAPGTVHELALGETDTRVEFAIDTHEEPGFSHGAIKQHETPIDAQRDIVVDQVTVDGLVEEGTIAEPTVVKIDVEGAEGRVLEGMSSLLESGTIRAIFLEIHKPTTHRLSIEDFGDSETELLQLLRANDFELESSHVGENEHHVIATR